MMSNGYRKIGDFIQQVKVKNTDGKLDILYGIKIDKYFMPSVANVVGTNLSKYKVVKPNQFACNRMHVGRDYRVPIALSKYDYSFIVSPAYDVFEIIDESQLLPEYLMMWFSRVEFDRNAWFYTDTDVRGKLGWDSLCDMQLPVPSPEKQAEIVAEYNTITHRIKLNEQLNQKLEETAQAIYKHWFVDFEFPDEEGKPYKSNGGKMVYCDELERDIPEGWKDNNIEHLCDIVDGDRGKNYPKQSDFFENEYCLFLNAGNVSKKGFNFTNNNFISQPRDILLRKGKLTRQDVVLTTRGTVGNVAYYSNQIEFTDMRINSGMVIFRSHDIQYSLFVYCLMRSTEMKMNIENFISGSAQPQLPINDIKKILTLIPKHKIIISFAKTLMPIQNHIESRNKGKRRLLMLKELVLTKMSKLN